MDFHFQAGLITKINQLCVHSSPRGKGGNPQQPTDLTCNTSKQAQHLSICSKNFLGPWEKREGVMGSMLQVD